MVKEACATLAAIVAISANPQKEFLEDAGFLLLSTLVTLKHQGGAFAAHKSLQSLSKTCFKISNSELSIREIPAKWIGQLIAIVSDKETVQNSTLRRSTGYGLGFLSIMRAEPQPRKMCSSAVSSLLRLALPPASMMRTKLRQILWAETFLYASGIGSIMPYVDDRAYAVRGTELFAAVCILHI